MFYTRSPRGWRLHFEKSHSATFFYYTFFAHGYVNILGLAA